MFGVHCSIILVVVVHVRWLTVEWMHCGGDKVGGALEYSIGLCVAAWFASIVMPHLAAQAQRIPQRWGTQSLQQTFSAILLEYYLPRGPIARSLEELAHDVAALQALMAARMWLTCNLLVASPG